MGFFDSLFGDKQKKETTSTQTGDSSYGLTPDVMNYWKSISGMYGPDAWKNIDPNQYQQQAIEAGAGYASGLNPAVTQAMGIGQTGIDPNRIAQFQNPHTQQVIDASLRDMDDADSRENARTNANAAKLGALSGTQPLVARNLAASRQADARNSMISNLRSQGFDKAAGLAGQDVNARLSGLGAAGNIVGQQAGITNQSFGQGTQLWNQGWQNAQMPYQLNQQGAQTLSGLAGASGQHTSGTATGTETSTASPSPFSAIMGGIGAGMKMYAMSDERIKENIKPIGETYDGQSIYKYNLKGSPTTQIGLMAQDVEKHRPDAVGSISGLKMVDYDKATQGAERERKADGGAVNGNDPHARLSSAFEAIHGMLHKARGGSVMTPRFAGGGDVALGDWGAGTTVTPAGFDYGTAGDELSGLSKKMQRPSSQGGGDMLGRQQDALAGMLGSMGKARPGFADGGFAGEWGETGPLFDDRPGEVSGLGAPMFAGIGSGVSRSELPPPREPVSPSINAPISHADLIGAIKGFEGFKPKAYGDYKQHSIGYGTRATRPDETITREEADRRLADEVAAAGRHVDAFAPNLDPGTRAALTSLTFNAGTDWQKSGLGAAIKSGDMDTARKLFVQYNRAGGKENDGLTNRRNAEVAWIGAKDAPMGSIEPPRYLSPTTPDGVLRANEHVAGYHSGLAGDIPATGSNAFAAGKTDGLNAGGVGDNFKLSPTAPGDWGASEPSKEALWPWERQGAATDRPVSVASNWNAVPSASRGAVSDPPSDKGWFGNLMDRLSKPRDVNERPSRLEDIGTMLMAVKSPRFNAPFEGMAQHAIAQNQARMEERRIDNQVAEMLGQINGKPTLAAQQAIGKINGVPTVAGRQADAAIAEHDAARKIREAGLTGVYDGQKTVAGRTAESGLQTAELQREAAQLKLDEAKNPERLYERRAALADKYALTGENRMQFIFDGKIPDKTAATETTEQKEVIKTAVDMAQKNIQSAQGAKDSLRLVDELRTLEKDPGIEAAIGPLDQYGAWQSVAGSIPFSKALGLANPDLSAKLQRMQKQLVLAGGEKMKGLGAQSDADAARLEKAVGDLTGARTKKEFEEALQVIEGSVVGAYDRGVLSARQFPKLSEEFAKAPLRGARKPDAPAASGSQTQGSPSSTIPQIRSDAEYDALPSGAVFIDPTGRKRIKP